MQRIVVSAWASTFLFGSLGRYFPSLVLSLVIYPEKETASVGYLLANPWLFRIFSPSSWL